jgi:hypothetical protein
VEPQSQSGTKEISLAVIHCYLLDFRGPVDTEQVKRLIAAMPRLLRLRARQVRPARLAQSSRPSQQHSRTASMCHAAEDERVVICGAGLAGEHLLPPFGIAPAAPDTYAGRLHVTSIVKATASLRHGTSGSVRARSLAVETSWAALVFAPLNGQLKHS